MCWPGHAERIAGSGAWNTLWWLEGILLYAPEAEQSGRSPWAWSRQRRVAEEHTTVHVYNRFPLEATRVSLSPASRTCNHFVLKQALGLAICFALRGAEARGGVEDKETSEDGSLNHAGRWPRFTRCRPRVLLSVAAQVSKLRSINHSRSMVKPS